MNHYTCKACHEPFQSEESVEAADEESVMFFGVKRSDPDGETVCEKCWLEVLESHGAAA